MVARHLATSLAGNARINIVELRRSRSIDRDSRICSSTSVSDRPAPTSSIREGQDGVALTTPVGTITDPHRTNSITQTGQAA